MKEILEEKFFRIDVANGPCMVHENPVASNLLLLLKHATWGVLRGLVKDENIYWWDASRATHHDVATFLGVDLWYSGEEDGETKRDPRAVTLSKERDGRAYLSADPEMLTHRGLHRLSQNKEVVT